MDFLTLVTSVVPDRSLGFTITVIVAGLGIVLGTLAVLIVVFRVFGAVMSSLGNKKKKTKNNSNIIAPAPEIKKVQSVPKAPVVEQGISGEVVAAISAAVYAAEGESSSVITSITTARRENPITGRNPWAQAAVVDNTRPF